MANNAKKYLITAVILGSIAAGSALLIAGTHALTKDTIAANEQKRVDNGLAEVFEAEEVQSEVIKLEKKFDFEITSYYDVKDNNGNQLGYAFKTTGSNPYGKISLIIGYSNDYFYKGLSVVSNEQSFASTLNKKYLVPVMAGERDISDVSCGATYGAKLVRDMVNETEKVVEYMKGANNG